MTTTVCDDGAESTAIIVASTPECSVKVTNS